MMWEFGGVYADLDTGPTQDLDLAKVAGGDAFFVRENYGYLSQYFIAAARPKHPLFFMAVIVVGTVYRGGPASNGVRTVFVADMKEVEREILPRANKVRPAIK